MLNEPIPGQGVFWSSVGGKPYPVSLRALSFEHLYRALDPAYNRPGTETFARRLKAEFDQELEECLETIKMPLPVIEDHQGDGHVPEAEPVDTLSVFKQQVIAALRRKRDFMERMQNKGMPWGVVKGYIVDELPKTFEEQERADLAYTIVREALESIFGTEDEGWHTYTAPRKG